MVVRRSSHPLRGLLLCPILALLLVPRSASADAPLGLEDAVRIALANNERALKAPLRVVVAEGGVDKARAAFLPTLAATGTSTIKDPVAKGASLGSAAGTVTLTQPIVSLSAFPLYSQARHNLEAERWGATEDKRQLAFDTARAFMLVLGSENLHTAAVQRLARAKADEGDASARAAAQLTSTNDVTRAKVETAAAAGQVAQTQGSVEQAYLQLAFLVGQPVAGPLASPERTNRAAENGGASTPSLVQAAEGRRPDLRSAEEKTTSLRDFAAEPLYRLAPTLTGTATVQGVPDPVPPATARSESLQLNLTWTIYDAGVRYSDRKTRVAQADSAAYDEKNLRRSVATGIGVAFAALKASREGYRVAAEGVTAATQNTDETAILYKQGLARAIEVTDANASRYDAEVTRETARLAMQNAYLDLRLALGYGPLDDDNEQAQASPPPTTPAAPPAPQGAPK